MSKIMDQVKELSAQIAKASSEHEQILAGTEEAGKTKETIKSHYSVMLDQGDESGMSQCLADIRTANAKVEELQVELERFPSLISKLRERQKEISTEARAKRPEAEQAVRVAQENLKRINGEIYNASYSLLSQINELDNSLTKDKKSISVGRPSKIKVT